MNEQHSAGSTDSLSECSPKTMEQGLDMLLGCLEKASAGLSAAQVIIEGLDARVARLERDVANLWEMVR